MSGCSVGRASDYWSRDHGFNPRPGRHLYWLGRCQYQCDRLRQKSWSPSSVSVWQHRKLSDVGLGTRRRDRLVADDDVNKPTNQPTNQTNKPLASCGLHFMSTFISDPSHPLRHPTCLVSHFTANLYQAKRDRNLIFTVHCLFCLIQTSNVIRHLFLVFIIKLLPERPISKLLG